MLSNTEKSRFIVEKVLGECWHHEIYWDEEDNARGWTYLCIECQETRYSGFDNPDFYSTDLDEQAIKFFRLWNCIKGKEWFMDFINHFRIRLVLHQIGEETWPHGYLDIELINCSALADAVVEYRGGEDA